ncbi:hypothetical protein HFO99_30515 [Rhizobium leguminosarum]|uniref:hypothetical protein n=1 Tax=Rhizobium leguminosarum TaxID=384 RepID=UPI001C954B4D|nr:hypothetical protein [Rhizobium leguminosarum]MBY5338190.1 hypothetical protein [Rhizobium leguminosarum]
MTKKERTHRPAPQGELLSIEDSMTLLSVGRTRFWQLRDEFKLEPVSWSARGKKPKGLLYRREDVLKLKEGPQGVQIEPAQPAPAESPPIDPKKVRAVDAGFKVMPGFENITVEEWHEANRDALRRKQSAHLPDLE